MTWLEAHRESERLASEAEAAMREGASPRAYSLYRAAATEEAHALSMIGTGQTQDAGGIRRQCHSTILQGKRIRLG